MPFRRRLLHYGPNPNQVTGSLSDRAIAGCWFELRRQGGCGAGELRLKDRFPEREAIQIGDWVACEYEEGDRWYLGRVVVVDRLGGFIEQVPADCGFLCQSVDDFSLALNRLSAPSLRDAFSSRAECHADNAFSLKRFAAGLIGWFDRVAHGSSSKGIAGSWRQEEFRATASISTRNGMG